MNDSLALKNYDLIQNSTVYLLLRLRGGMIIFVKHLSGKEIEIDVDSSNTIEELK